MQNQYSINDFKEDQDLFNEIAGTTEKLSPADVYNQMKIINEEVNEIKEAFEEKDVVKLLDGAVDSLFTVLGLTQKLEKMGVDVFGAMQRVAHDNLSKFPESYEEVLDTIEMYAEKGIKVKVEHDVKNGVYVIRDEADKVRKPKNFKPTDLSEFVPETLKKEFFNA